MSNEVVIRVTTQDHTQRGVDQATSRMHQLRGAIGRVGTLMAGVFGAQVVGKLLGGFTGFVSDSIKSASDLNESYNAVQKVFGAASNEILEWGKKNATSIGLSTKAFNEAATPLGAVLKNQGLALQDAAHWTENLTERAADMASVFNTSVPEALEAIQAGIRGEQDPLEKYGVSLSAAKVEAEAMAETHKKAKKELTATEKATARLNLIMKQTASTEGDFKGTSDQLANAQRIQQAELENTKAAIGQRLLPVQLMLIKAQARLAEVLEAKVLPVINKVADWFQENPSRIRAAAGIIGGLLVAAFIAWAGAATAAAAATIAATWPVILIVGAIAGLAAGLIYAYRHWETFRVVMQAVGRFMVGYVWPVVKFVAKAVGREIQQMADFAGKGFRWLARAALFFFGQLIDGAAQAFGWIPGIGPKLRRAQASFHAFANSVNQALNGIHNRSVSVNVQTRINGRSASITDFGHVVNIRSGGHTVRAMATGGIATAAAGGMRSRLTLVGEQGPELAQLSPGSHVYSAPDTRRMLSESGGRGPGGVVRVVFDSPDRDFLQFIRKVVRIEGGGDVQVAFGVGQ